MKGSDSEGGNQTHNVQETGLMGQGSRRVNKQGVPKPGNQNHYGTKTQGKRVVGESIQIESTTRNPITRNYNKQRIHKTGDNWRRGTENK